MKNFYFTQSYLFSLKSKKNSFKKTALTIIFLFLFMPLVAQTTKYGTNALKNNIGINNSAFGYYTLSTNYSGVDNTATGAYSLISNYDGKSNTANGVYSLGTNSSGSNNSAFGYYALYSNTTGLDNSAFGYQALGQNTSGINNTAGGFYSLYSNTKGSYNVAVGDWALNNNTTGNNNTALGGRTLSYNYTGSNNTAVGNDADLVSGVVLTNATAIGYKAVSNASNKVVIGNTTVTSIGGYKSWTVLSDARFKKNIEENVKGLEFIMALRPVTYNMDIRKLDAFLGVDKKQTKPEVQRIDEQAIKEKEAIRYTGFLAQEVEKAAQAVNYDFSGVMAPTHEKDNYQLAYSEFVVPLVKAVQEQQKMIEQQQEQIEELKNLVAKLSNSSLKGENTSGIIKIYPNPSKGVFTITTGDMESAQIEVHDLAGNSIRNVELKNNRTDYQLNLSGQAKGTYIVNIMSDGNKITKKIVLE